MVAERLGARRWEFSSPFLTKLFLSKRSGNFLERHGSGQVWSLSATARISARRAIFTALKNLLGGGDPQGGRAVARQPRFREQQRRFVSKFRAADSRFDMVPGELSSIPAGGDNVPGFPYSLNFLLSPRSHPPPPPYRSFYSTLFRRGSS